MNLQKISSLGTACKLCLLAKETPINACVTYHIAPAALRGEFESLINKDNYFLLIGLI